MHPTIIIQLFWCSTTRWPPLSMQVAKLNPIPLKYNNHRKNERKIINMDWYNLNFNNVDLLFIFLSVYFLKCLCQSLSHSSHKRTLQTSSSSSPLSSHLLTQQQFRSRKQKDNSNNVDQSTSLPFVLPPRLYHHPLRLRILSNVTKSRTYVYI